MGSKWSSSLKSTRPPDGSSRCVFISSRRVFASSKNICYLPSRRPCFSGLFHSGHLVPGGLMVEAVSEVFAVCWSHSPCGSFSGSPSMASAEMALFLLQNVSGRRADARRGFAMFLIMHLFLLTSLSSLNVSRLLAFGCNKIYISVSALGLAVCS